MALVSGLALALLVGVAAAAPQLVRSDFRISTVGADGDADREAATPAVTYNAGANEYLVVWRGDGLATNEEVEVFGQRLSASGTEIGADFRISNVGADGDASRAALQTALTYNAGANEYLVVWRGDGLATNNELEVFGQRLSASGTEIGADFRISNVGADGDVNREAHEPAVTYNAAADEYLVVWRGDGLATDEDIEVFGQRVSASGTEIGADFRISNVGAEGDLTRQPFEPAVTYNARANEYLVVWEGDGLATDEEFEIFGRRLAEPPSPPPPPPPAPTGKCAGVVATKTGTPGADVIRGTAKRDVIAALGGRDTVRSLGGNDLVCGGAGNDRIFAGKGKDNLRGDGGDDKLNGEGGNDDLRGGKGRDVLKGGPGKDKERQ